MRHHGSAAPPHGNQTDPERPTSSAGQANPSEPLGAGRQPRLEERPALPGAASDSLQRAEDWVRRELARPGVGAILVGTALIVAAATAGVSETLVGAIGAYAVYRMLRRRKAEHTGRR